MRQDLIPAWSDGQKRDFRHAPITFAHRLAETGLFDDEPLAELLERYPDELIDINILDYEHGETPNLRTGRRGALDGAATLEAVKQGRVWLQLRLADRNHAALGRAVHQAFREMSGQAKGFRPVDLYGQLLLSAPNARVHYHADVTGVVLFHLRGRKRIWIYPVDEAHIPHRCMEKALLRESTEYLPYRPEMDERARIFDLEPGMALAWPLHAPHRVENLGEFNVSFSADYQTWATRVTNGAVMANGLLHRWGLPAPALDSLPTPARAVMWAAAAGAKKAGLVRDRRGRFERSFALDEPKAEAETLPDGA